MVEDMESLYKSIPVVAFSLFILGIVVGLFIAKYVNKK